MREKLLTLLHMQKFNVVYLFNNKVQPPTSLLETPSLSAKKNYLEYIQTFRSLAILCIVGVHCLGFFGLKDPSIFNDIIHPILHRSTFFFVFIAGYLFQHLSYNFEARKYWHKKFQYVLMPYLVISLPMIVLRYVTKNPPDIALEHFSNFRELPFVAQMGYYYITGTHLIPFWFIPMICLYYLAGPLLVKLDRTRVFYWFLPLFIAISFIYTRAELHETLRMFVHFFSIYVLGMFFSRYKDRIYELSNQRMKTLLIVTILILIGSIIFFNAAYKEQIIFVQKLFLCWSLIFMLKKFSKYIPQNINILADMSFGIYFLHYYFIFGIHKSLELATGSKFVSNSAVNFFVLLTIIVILCVAVLWVVKKIAGKNSRLFTGY